ncbi:hypothetical protein [Nocardiopsis alba]|uniref:hypothetical protein n=1 Tax=Nocardiopsis alba TaxID=53437 RepID=UPI0033B54202
MAELIHRVAYEVVPMHRLPLPLGIRDPECMITPMAWAKRRLRRRVPWLLPPQKPRECCFYHSIDWRRAAEVAVRLVRQAQAAGLQGVRIDDYVDEHVEAEKLADPEEDAVVVLLIGEAAGILLHDPGFPAPYMDGRHRVAAQLDQGVAETVVQRFEVLDPETGLPVVD